MTTPPYQLNLYDDQGGVKKYEETHLISLGMGLLREIGDSDETSEGELEEITRMIRVTRKVSMGKGKKHVTKGLPPLCVKCLERKDQSGKCAWCPQLIGKEGKVSND